MKFVYWGAVNSGSDHLNRMFGFNQKQHIFFNSSPYKFSKFIYPEPYRQQEYIFYKPRNKDKLEIISVRNTRVKDPFKEETYQYAEFYNFVDKRTYRSQKYCDGQLDLNFDYDRSGIEIVEGSNLAISYSKGNITKTIDLNEYEEYLKHAPETWENYALDDMIDGELLVRPNPLLGFVENNRVHNTTNKIVSLLQETINLVPYKENILDSMISKLNIFNPPKQSKKYTNRTGRPVSFKTIVDAYKRDKEIVWNHLDEFTREQRDIEQALVDNNIPYDYFNLDEDNYKRFNCDIILPRKYSHPNFNLEENEVKKNFTVLENMAKEYIMVRSLQDVRLHGRIKDKI